MSSKTTSRRAILAGAATLPALAVPTVAAADSDAAGITARTEQVIDLLRTRHVGPGWKIDEDAAEKVLQWARAGVPGDDGFQVAVEFFSHHGQSLDWIIRGDPVGMICGAAGRSRRMLSLGQPVDPIFAAIERHRTTEDDFDKAIGGDAEERLGSEKFYELEAGWSDIEGRALDDMLATRPTTIPGVIALLTYVGGFELPIELRRGEGFLHLVADALRNIIVEVRS